VFAHAYGLGSSFVLAALLSTSSFTASCLWVVLNALL